MSEKVFKKTDKIQIIKMAFWVLISAAFQAFALTSFSVPAKIYPSGISGLSRLVSDILKDYASLNIPYFYFYYHYLQHMMNYITGLERMK